jgi:DNA-binding HxlR family transcriptional regulator
MNGSPAAGAAGSTPVPHGNPKQFREMETYGLVHREVYHQVPPRVEYSLTEFGHSLNTALIPLGDWGEKHMQTIEALPRD